LVIVAVGEEDLDNVLKAMPEAWRRRVALLQNELLPRDWERCGIVDPTVIVVWFDKKKGRPFVSVLPTVVSGPSADLVVGALQAIDVPCYQAAADQLLFELAKKNLYILTVNIAGLPLPAGTTVGQLWSFHQAEVRSVAREILDLQDWRAETTLPRSRLMDGMLQGFAGDPDHICTGRSARKRLRRVLETARLAGISTPTLAEIEQKISALSPGG
jgi:hypothetical protein